MKKKHKSDDGTNIQFDGSIPQEERFIEFITPKDLSSLRVAGVEVSFYMPEVRGSNPRRAPSLRKCKKSVTITYHCDML